MRTESMCIGRPRPGAALIEALIATVLLATTGIALVTLLGQTEHSMRSVRTSERQIRDASEHLDRLVLLNRADVIAREGQSSFAGWTLSVTALGSGLFDIAIAPTDTSRSLLQTTIYRPDTADAQP
jgi:Tfp pilus assembly protein PilV